MAYQYSKNSIYFITQKTSGGQKFFIEDENKEIVFDQLYKAGKESGVKIIAFAILSNHYHLLLKINEVNAPKNFFQILHGGISYRYNKETGVQRSLWENYRVIWQVINDENYYKYIGYVLGNPLKHSLVFNYEHLRFYKYTNIIEVEELLGTDFVKEIIQEAINFDDDYFERNLIKK